MSIKKVLYSIAALISLGIGIIGILLPILPSTPFFLLAAFCTAQGSSRFRKWLEGQAWYHKYILALVKERGMTLKAKWSTFGFAASMILVAVVFVDIFWVRVFLISLICIKGIVFVKFIETVKEPVYRESSDD